MSKSIGIYCNNTHEGTAEEMWAEVTDEQYTLILLLAQEYIDQYLTEACNGNTVMVVPADVYSRLDKMVGDRTVIVGD